MRETTDGYRKMRAAIVRRWNQGDECWEWAVELEPYNYIGYITEDSGEAPWAWRVETSGASGFAATLELAMSQVIESYCGAVDAVARSIAGNRAERHYAKIFSALTASAIGDLYRLPGDLYRFQLYAVDQPVVDVCRSGVFEDLGTAVSTARSQYRIMVGAAKCPT